MNFQIILNFQIIFNFLNKFFYTNELVNSRRPKLRKIPRIPNLTLNQVTAPLNQRPKKTPKKTQNFLKFSERNSKKFKFYFVKKKRKKFADQKLFKNPQDYSLGENSKQLPYELRLGQKSHDSKPCFKQSYTKIHPLKKGLKLIRKNSKRFEVKTV